MIQNVTYGGFTVKVTPRSNGKYDVRWKELGKWKKTTKTIESDALEFARDTARRLSNKVYITQVTPEEGEALQIIKAQLGNRSIITVAVEVAELLAATPSDMTLGYLRNHTKPSDMISFDEAFELMLEDAEDRGLRDYSLRMHKLEFRNFSEVHPKVLMRDLSTEMVYNHIKRGNIKPLYFNNRRRVWSKLINLIHKKKRGDFRYLFDGIDKRKEPSKIPPIFTIKQCKDAVELFKKQSPELLPMFAIAVFAGLRPSEVRRLKDHHICLETGYIHCDLDICHKLQQERFVKIQPNLSTILKEYGFKVWKSDKLWKKLSSQLREAGIIEKWELDVTRHSYISYRVAQTSNLNMVADEAGNSADVVKKRYRRPLMKEQGEAWFEIC